MGESALYDTIHRLRMERDQAVAMVARMAPHLVVLRDAISGTGRWSEQANRAIRTLADLAPEAVASGDDAR